MECPVNVRFRCHTGEELRLRGGFAIVNAINRNGDGRVRLTRAKFA